MRNRAFYDMMLRNLYVAWVDAEDEYKDWLWLRVLFCWRRQAEIRVHRERSTNG